MKPWLFERKNEAAKLNKKTFGGVANIFEPFSLLKRQDLKFGRSQSNE